MCHFTYKEGEKAGRNDIITLMPKVKSRKSALKRYKITSSGKILRGQSMTSHLRVRKSAKHKRRLSGTIEVTGPYAKKLIKALGIRVRRNKHVVKTVEAAK
jgi:large subunit ribosomal protein L35